MRRLSRAATRQEARRMTGGHRTLPLVFVFALATIWFSVPLPLRGQAAAPSTPVDVAMQHDVPVKMRDGVTLYADIYRPNLPGAFPVILMRTPYDKSVSWAVGPAFRMVRRGYVIIVQDVRGRYTSEGDRK